MNLKIFIESLSDIEKRELLTLLSENVTRERIEDFIIRNNVSTRLCNALMSQTYYIEDGQRRYKRIFNYVDEVNKISLFQTRNAGNKTWNEFESYLKQ